MKTSTYCTLNIGFWILACLVLVGVLTFAGCKSDVWDLYDIKCYSGGVLIYHEQAKHLRGSIGVTYYSGYAVAPDNAACVNTAIDTGVSKPDKHWRK